MGEYTVYRHVTPNGKMYVGITSQDVKQRWRRGNGYYNNKHFYSAINKYGWDNIRHEVLLSGLSKNDANLAEMIFIHYWKLTDSNYGYNIENGGDAIDKHSDETKRKISESHKGKRNPFYGKRHSLEMRQKMSRDRAGEKHPNYGKPMSERQRQMLSEHRRGESNPMYGRHHSDKAKRKISDGQSKRRIRQIDPRTNETLMVFESMHEASRTIGVPACKICACCKHYAGRKTASGYKWEYDE